MDNTIGVCEAFLKARRASAFSRILYHNGKNATEEERLARILRFHNLTSTGTLIGSEFAKDFGFGDSRATETQEAYKRYLQETHIEKLAKDLNIQDPTDFRKWLQKNFGEIYEGVKVQTKTLRRPFLSGLQIELECGILEKDSLYGSKLLEKIIGFHRNVPGCDERYFLPEIERLQKEFTDYKEAGYIG